MGRVGRWAAILLVALALACCVVLALGALGVSVFAPVRVGERAPVQPVVLATEPAPDAP